MLKKNRKTRKQTVPLVSYKNLLSSISLSLFCAILYVIEIYWLDSTLEGIGEAIRKYNILTNIANSIVAALVIFFIFESRLNRRIKRFFSDVFVDEAVLRNALPIDRAPEVVRNANLCITPYEYIADAITNIALYIHDKCSVSEAFFKDQFSTYELRPSDEFPEVAFEVHGVIKYCRAQLPQSLYIVAHAPGESAERLPFDEQLPEFYWKMITDNNTQAANFLQSFEVEVSVEGQVYEQDSNLDRTKNRTRINHFRLSDENYRQLINAEARRSGLDDAKFNFLIRFKALQSRRYGFIAHNFTKITYNFSVTLDYSRMRDFIKEVWHIGHIACSKTTSADSRETEPTVSISSPGWVLPDTGLVFSWSEARDAKENAPILLSDTREE